MKQPQFNPFKSSTENLAHLKTCRRLFRITFNCGHCKQRHRSEHYITKAADTPAHLCKLVSDMMLKPSEDSRKLTAHFAAVFHNLPEKADTGKCKVTSVVILDEENYTCDDCGQEFPNIAGLRLHRGEDAYTKRPNAPSACPAA